MTVTTLARSIIGGVDTHLDVHVAAALDERGTLLGVESFPTAERGYKALLGWLSGFGTVELVGVEGTGSYGAGLTRHLQAEKVRVVEVDRPNRQRRRRKGKSDPQDAIGAARAALSGDATGEAKTEGRKRRIHAGFAGCPDLGPQGQDPGAQPDAQLGLDGSRSHPKRTA
jgi:transposase